MFEIIKGIFIAIGITATCIFFFWIACGAVEEVNRWMLQWKFLKDSANEHRGNISDLQREVRFLKDCELHRTNRENEKAKKK